MPAGFTTTDSLAESLNDMVMEARQVREHKGTVAQLVDRKTLGEGMGLTWNEVSMAKLTAQAVASETDDLENPQQMTDTNLPATPNVVGIHTYISDRTKVRIAKVALAQLGSLAQNAIERQKDEDGITLFDGFTSLAGAGQTLSFGHITAAVANIESNTTEPGPPPYNAVLHGFQIKDIQDEIVAGVGTYPIPEGPTAEVFRNGFKGMIAGAGVFPDNNITIDSSFDAKGAVFSKMGIVLIQGRAPWQKNREEPQRGGGGMSIWLYDEYVYVERSSGNWAREIYSDATAPTS